MLDDLFLHTYVGGETNYSSQETTLSSSCLFKGTSKSIYAKSNLLPHFV